MGKPLLTDEIIERANRGEIFYDDQYLEDDEETKVIRTDLYDTIVPYEEEEEETQGFLDKWKDRNTFIKVVALKMLNVASFNENLI